MSNMYNNGLDVLGGTPDSWVTNTYIFMMLKSGVYTFNPDNEFVSSLIPASSEISESGYSRQTVTTPVRTVNSHFSNPPDTIIYNCDDLNFGSIDPGQTTGAIVLYKFVTNDSDSVLVCYFPIIAIDTSQISPFTVMVSADGLIQVAQS